MSLTYNIFSIPKRDIGKEWISFVKKYNRLFQPKNTSKICELHFDPGLYEISSTSVYKTRRLKENAVPNICKQSNL